MKRLFKRNSDRFRLDLGREVEIDGHTFVVSGFSAYHGSYSHLQTLNVEFEKREKKVAQ